MKKGLCALFLIVLSIALRPCLAEEPEEALVAEIRRTARAVTMMEEAYALIPEESLWQNGWPSYAQQYGYDPIALTPDEAYSALRAAYEEDEGVQSYEGLFYDWGMTNIHDWKGFVPTYCYPMRRVICEEIDTVRGTLSIEVVTFYGNGQWEEAGALVFAKYWGGEWQLIDYMPYEPENVLLCGEDYSRGMLIQFLCHGHGTGYYAEQIALYNPLTQRCEGGYTRVGHDVPRDYGLYLTSQVFLDTSNVYGVSIVRSTAFATSEWNAQECDDVYTQRAQDAHLYVYALNEQDGSFALTTDMGIENVSPALLMNVARYDELRIVVP